MSTVLAAVDASPAARPVVEAAIRFGELTDSPVEMVHVVEADAEVPRWLAAQFDLQLRLLEGPVDAALAEAVAEQRVGAAVVGARSTPGGKRPVGHAAFGLLASTTKPVVVVPPEAPLGVEHHYRRLLLPIEGDATLSRATIEQLDAMLAREVAVHVVHVFTSATVPRVADRAVRDMVMWEDEFVARHCPSAARIEVCTGPIGPCIVRVAEVDEVDVVVLTWKHDLTAGRAAVVRDVLSRSHVPTLLIPEPAA
jgi:hypothetical protein